MNKKTLIGTIVAGSVVMAGVAGLAVAQNTAKDPKLSQAQAIEIALAEVAGEVKEVELENEYTKLVYEIEVLAEDGVLREVEIHADTGEILEIEIEDDEDDAEEDDA